MIWVWYARNHCLYTTVIHNASQQKGTGHWLPRWNEQRPLHLAQAHGEKLIRVQQGVERGTVEFHRICSYAVDNLCEENRGVLTATTPL